MYRLIRKQIVIHIVILLVLFCVGCSLNTTPPSDTSAPTTISIEDAKNLISAQLPKKDYEFHIQFQREEIINNCDYYYFQVYTLSQEPLEGDMGSYNQQFTYAWIYVNSETGELYADNPDGSLTPWKAA